MNWAVGAALVFGAGTFWSLGGLLMRLMEAAGPWQILLYRSVAMGVFFLVLLTVSGSLARFRGGWPLVVAGLCVGCAFVGFVFSVTNTTIANTFFLLATQPLLTALLAWRILGEVPDSRAWTAMAIALAGVACMVLDGIAQGTLFGNAMALVSALGFAALTVTLRKNRHLDMRPGFALGGLFTAGFAGTALLFTTGAESVAVLQETFKISNRDLTLCLLSGTVQIGLGMLLFTLGTRRISAGEAALIALSEVVLAPIWVWLVVNEVPSGLTLIGGGILLTGLLFRAWPKRLRPSAGPISTNMRPSSLSNEREEAK